VLPFLQFILAIPVIIIAAKFSGYISYRLRQPAVAGEVLAGLNLGPSVSNFLDWPVFADPHLGENITHLAQLGILSLVFIAGLDLYLSNLAR
jgi:Kef-type K+ transport system membrane component KefB